MKKIVNLFIDKFLRVLLLFDFSFKKDDGYNYQRDFLGKEDYWKDLSEIFKPVTEIVNNDFDKIYSIKDTLYNEPVLSKIKYCIENKFWGIFAFTLSDGYQMSNEEYFNQPSIRVYLIENSSKENTIVVVKSKVKHFEVLLCYPKMNVWVRNFKDRKLVYSKDKNFLSL
jgi:hypothetical protein